VEVARTRMVRRQGKANAKLVSADMDTQCALEPAAGAILQQAVTKLALSARAYHRVLKVARTIADLGGGNRIVAANVAEAIQYRMSNLAAWG
jgi:magnesium chelatase family protein